MAYTNEVVQNMAQMLRDYRLREALVRERLLLLPLQSDEGRQYVAQGVTRRLATIELCLDRVFNVLPVQEAQPGRAALIEAAVLLQAFVMHVTGVMDNLARIWCLERGFADENGAPIPDAHIGLAPQNRSIRASLSEEFRDRLQRADDWFAYLKNYRDAFAHRIPLYIPPRTLGPEDEQRYRQIDLEHAAALQQRDYIVAGRLIVEMQTLGRFDPMMMHAFGNRPQDGRPVRLHPQMICDHATVVEICELMATELERGP